MSTVKGLRAGVVAGILGGMALLIGPARTYAQEQFSTERPGSILIFPKVINTGVPGPETIVQISNTSNIPVFAHCLYTDGQTVNGQPNWTVTDFDLVLTRQQPTHFAVSAGRAVNPMDGETGLDPGLIPPVAEGFTGFLTCVQVDSSGAPMGGNALKGEATIGNINGPGEANSASKYNAIAIPAIDGGMNIQPNSNVLSLDNVEYAACPRDLLLNFPAEGSADPALEGAGNTASVVSGNLTVVPCGMDFENLTPTQTALSVTVHNEFEDNSSASFPVNCWRSLSLSDPVLGTTLTIGTLDTEFGTADLHPPTGELPGLGVLTVLRTADDGTSDTASSNLFWDNARCVGGTAVGQGCTTSQDCPGGTCAPATVDSEILLPCSGNCGLPPPTLP